MRQPRPARLLPVAALAGLLGLAVGASAGAPTDYTVAAGGRFLSEDDGKRVTAEELSGIACRAVTGTPGRLSCLAVDNEAPFAQVVTIENGVMTPGRTIALAERGQTKPPEGAIGSEPGTARCSDGLDRKPENRYGVIDGEGVAHDGRWFYVIGSHGCTRKNRRYRPGMFLLMRLQLDEAGNPKGPVQRTFRLSEVLAGSPNVEPTFTKDLDENGLNIEGIAARGGRLLIGLRAPTTDEGAFILNLAAEDLFSPNAQLGARTTCRIDLGKDTGVRDLSMLPDGRLLILSGPGPSDPAPGSVVDRYALWATPIGSDGCPEQPRERLLGGIGRQDHPKAGAEAVTPVRCDGNTQRVLVFYDGIENGGAREYEVPLGAGACQAPASRN